MTGYHIKLGYMSGASCDGDWDDLKAIANSITREELRTEYLAYEVVTECEDGCCQLDEFIERFFIRDDSTISFIEDVEADESPQIMLLASSSGVSRHIKEGTRRAFCRLVMMKAHRAHIEICINVA